jgi:hypothetical protein
MINISVKVIGPHSYIRLIIEEHEASSTGVLQRAVSNVSILQFKGLKVDMQAS